MHEVVTLQFGQRANFVATHFWNIQEAYFTYSENELPLVNHDIHFRAGVGADGTDTFTPRTVIYDLKGGFGSLRKYNALYDAQEESPLPRVLWNGSTHMQQLKAIEPSKYQKNLEQGLPTFQLTSSDVRYWSDFNRLFYHPRSIVQLNEYELNSQTLPFENWGVGQELFQSLDKEDDLLDRDLRPFVEECDQIQGLQIFASTDDAWGGFTASYLDNLRDEFGKTCIWVWGLEDGERVAQRKQTLRRINSAKSMQILGQQASAYVTTCTIPPGLPKYINLETTSEWSTAALTAAGIETALLPTRLRQTGGRQALMPMLEAALNTNGRQTVFELGATLPLPVASDGTRSGSGRKSVSERFEVCYTPTMLQRLQEAKHHAFSQIVTDREAVDDGADEEDRMQVDRAEHADEEESTNERQVTMCRGEGRAALMESRTRLKTSLLFPLLDSFPDKLFVPPIPHGSGLPLHAGLTTTSYTQTRLKDMREMIGRALGSEERELLFNDLIEIGQAYEHGWSDDSESGIDE